MYFTFFTFYSRFSFASHFFTTSSSFSPLYSLGRVSRHLVFLCNSGTPLLGLHLLVELTAPQLYKCSVKFVLKVSKDTILFCWLSWDLILLSSNCVDSNNSQHMIEYMSIIFSNNIWPVNFFSLIWWLQKSLEFCYQTISWRV